MQQYLDLLRDIRDNGVDRGDRTGTGTRAVFGRQLRFDLNEGFPILTTKKVHFKSVVNELIWFLSGDTNTHWLRENGVSIWDEWATEEGDLGPLYGAQWVKWPTRDGGEINQIDYVIDCLKNRPESRRILFHAWNVEYLPDETLSPQENVKAGRMALPPCALSGGDSRALFELGVQLSMGDSRVRRGACESRDRRRGWGGALSGAGDR